jgi:hypothetical protein
VASDDEERDDDNDVAEICAAIREAVRRKAFRRRTRDDERTESA